MFTRGEVLVKIAFFRRNIVTVFAHELLLATFGYFWVHFLIVTTVVGMHTRQIDWRNGLYYTIRKYLYMVWRSKTF